MQRCIVLPLEKLDEPYRIDKYNELFKEEKKDTTKKATLLIQLKPITIDTDLIMERLEQISPSFGAAIPAGCLPERREDNCVVYQ